MRKTFGRMVLVLATAGALLPAGAWAHDYGPTTTASTIGYDEDKGRFWGRVGSTEPACQANRRVRLEKHTDEGLKVVGKTRTDEDGHWKIAKPRAKGTFWVVIRRRIDTATGHDHSCRSGGSATVTVE